MTWFGKQNLQNDIDLLAQGKAVFLDVPITITQLGPKCGYCRDCKHWDSPSIPEFGIRGGCEAVDSEDEAKANAMAVTSSYEGASFLTMPNFGCVQFKSKE